MAKGFIEIDSLCREIVKDARAGVFKPVYDDKRNSEVLMLLMPMMINA